MELVSSFPPGTERRKCRDTFNLERILQLLGVPVKLEAEMNADVEQSARSRVNP